MAFSRIYLDTNCFIMAWEGGADQPVVGLMADLLAASPSQARPLLTTSQLTLAELLVNPYRQGNGELVHKYNDLLTSSEWLEVGPVTKDVLEGAAILRARHRGLKLPDAIHISTALFFRCSHILTWDQGIKGPYQLKHQKFGAYQGPSTEVDAIRPDGSRLQEVISWLQS